MVNYFNEIATPAWSIVCLLSTAIAVLITRLVTGKKDFLTAIMTFIFFLYVGGFFFVLVLCLGIVPNILLVTGLVPRDAFNLNAAGSGWAYYLLCCYLVWYVLSLAFALRPFKGNDTKNIININTADPPTH